MLRSILFSVLLSFSIAAQTTWVEVSTSSAASRATLLSLNLDMVPLKDRAHVYLTDPAEMQQLIGSGLSFSVLSNDAESFYRSRLSTEGFAVDGPLVFGQGSMGGYFTEAQMVLFMDALAAAYPQVMAPKVSLGTSIEGRDIWMWKISDNPLLDENEPEVLLDGVHHAREPMSMHSALYLAEKLCGSYGTDIELTALVNEREIYLVPMVNPDGYVRNQTTDPQGGGMWRKNRRVNSGGSVGVDLNRNYGYMWGYDNSGSSGQASSQVYRGTAAFSEPEALAMKLFAESRSISLGMTMHCYGQLAFIPPGYVSGVVPPQPWRTRYEDFAAVMATLGEGYIADYGWAILYAANGVTEDWWYGSLYGGMQVWSFGCEIGKDTDGFWPATSRILPIAEETFELLMYCVRIAGPELTLDASSVAEVGGSLPGVWESGETLQVSATARNGGTQPAATTMRLESSSPYLSLSTAVQSVGSMAPFGGTAPSPAGSLSVSIAPSAPAGAFVSFDLVIEAAGAAPVRTTFARYLNLPNVDILVDAFELPGSWTVGAPGDNAVRGVWVRSQPNGTTYQGQPFNPSADHTAAPGTQCWFTGQGTVGGSVGSEDVDGITTLVSPVMDLTSVMNAELRFHRWFMTSGDDTLTMELSNDGGSTWSVVGILSGIQNSWQETVIRVEDFMPRTSAMQLRLRANDDPNNSLCEAAIDDFHVTGQQALVGISLTSPISAGQTATVSLGASLLPLKLFGMGASLSATTGISVAGHLFPLDPDVLFLAVPSLPSVFQGFSGQLDAVGAGTAWVHIPPTPGLAGIEIYLAGGVFDASGLLGTSGAARLVIQ